MSEVDRDGSPPSGIRLPNFGLRRNRFRPAPGGTRAKNGAFGPGEVLFRYPITGIAFCCARAAIGHIVTAPAANRTNSRRLMGSPSIRQREYGSTEPAPIWSRMAARHSTHRFTLAALTRGDGDGTAEITLLCRSGRASRRRL